MCNHDNLGNENSRLKTDGANGLKSGTLSIIMHSPRASENSHLYIYARTLHNSSYL